MKLMESRSIYQHADIMDEIVEALNAAKIPYILVLSGVVFLLLGITGGRFKISVPIPVSRQKWLVIIGVFLLVV